MQQDANNKNNIYYYFIIIIYLTAIGLSPGGSSTTIGHNRQVTHITQLRFATRHQCDGRNYFAFIITTFDVSSSLLMPAFAQLEFGMNSNHV
jgi:hypothetical protein